MERMLQYVWKHKLYAESDLLTTDGTPVFVIDPGIPNIDAGPDFFNAKIRIGDILWVGNVEIHERASNWFAHHHDKDKAYNSVILHIVRDSNTSVYRTDNEVIPQLIFHVPKEVEENIEWLLSRDTPVACTERISKVNLLHLSGWIAALLTERLERKTQDIFTRLENNSKDWNEVFYITLMRNFGFNTNSDAFELLANSLPFRYILKHRNDPTQIESMFFGQAGLLNTEGDTYLQSLKREYDFLSKKYNLKPVEAFLFKSMRTRPVNFPHVRLAQMAAVWINTDLLFSKVLETDNLKGLRALFNVTPSEYWKTHYNFYSISSERKKNIGKNAADIILINTVIPVLFAYGKIKNRPEYCERALRLLEEIKPERNSIVDVFCKAGISAKNAGDTQALIQLRREYCDKKKCLYCRIGFKLIGK
jgi:Protein of unknown function (DUF2851).